MEGTSPSPPPSRKRRRLSSEDDLPNSHQRLPYSLTSSISPPPRRRNRMPEDQAPKVIKSPFQLTWIRDLPEACNKDAISLKDILGDPMISECWEFNYLHNLDFLMDAFDPDIRELVKVHVIHGFWKREDQSRLNLNEKATKYPNITLHTAYMPEMYGTHHTKMIVLLRHDDFAQIIIHTANMIPFDWTNMTQAVWISPFLPRLSPVSLSQDKTAGSFGSGTRFKLDFLNYLKAYDNNPKRVICKSLVAILEKHDFSAVRGALIGSVPGRHHIERDSQTCWGWAGLKSVLSSVPVQNRDGEIVIQISSIATLSEKWIENTLFDVMRTSKNILNSKSKFRIIFPTADEIRRSLNGYDSGSAIHTKIQSPAQAKQIRFLNPMLCHWAVDGEERLGAEPILDAGRKRAAPHIKTFIRFTDEKKSSIDWMLLTSANLSKQAWGEATNAGGDVRICSYELGVVVWPELFGEKSIMVPTFKTDTPASDAGKEGEVVIGARMPYDLPLVPYGKADLPWCATSSYKELDWKGESYGLE
ncbi:related to TDP1 Tyr-DNA phosphodiesterase [Rhynchosporium agropyri]|uniref:Related to TDP1 Tyr-DNA phosphodiesterase n=1 Tax=Rhynchosporium agropyri TaxID=914238 RepID=A0A1E1L6L6_9HELO|nr:related to TDP1 Tyr-DNA phosphodiesterase [Rhynchosporium agropyri]